MAAADADQFLGAAAEAMDLSFQPVPVLPGDDVTELTRAATTALRLGDGLTWSGDTVSATRAGTLRYVPPNRYWVDGPCKRYVPRVDDYVVGTVSDRQAEYYRVNVNGTCAAVLGHLAFDGAVKRNKPSLNVGDTVFARVVMADAHMDAELTCCAPPNVQRREWTTGEALFGQLRGGYAFKCSLQLARALLQPDSVVLNALGRALPFEVAVGCNGRVWLNASTPERVIVATNAILNSEHMPPGQVEAMVEQLVGQLVES